MGRRLLCMALVLAVLAPWAAAAPLAGRMPADAVVYMGWAGRNEAFDGSVFGQMLDSEPVRQIMGTLRRAIAAEAEEEPKARLAREAMDLALTALQHPLAVVMLPPAEAAPFPEGALLIELGEQAPAFAARINEILQQAGAPPEAMQQGQAQGVTYAVLVIGEDAPPIAWGATNGLFFATVGSAAPERLLAVVQGRGRTLDEAEGFVQAYRQVTGENEQGVFFLDAGQAKSIARGLMDPDDAQQVDRVLRAMGLDRASALVGVTRVVDRGMYSRMRLLSPGPHRGILALYDGAGLGEADFANLPADADLVLMAKLDPKRLLDELRRSLRAVEPRAAGELERGLAEIDEALGLSLEDDVLAHLGERVVIVSAPSLGGFLTGTAAAVQLKNPQAFRNSLAQLELKLEESFRPRPRQEWEDEWRYQWRLQRTPRLVTVESGGVRIRYVQGGGWMPVAPAWAVKDDQLLLAPWPQVLQAALAGPGEQTLAQAEPFRNIRRPIEGQPGMLMYVNLPSIARTAYGLPMIFWTMVAQQIGREVPPELAQAADGPVFRIDWLPSLKVAQQFLWPALSTAQSDENGVTFQSYGSLP